MRGKRKFVMESLLDIYSTSICTYLFNMYCFTKQHMKKNSFYKENKFMFS